MEQYTIIKFQKEFSKHLSPFGAIDLFYHLAETMEDQRYKTYIVNANKEDILKWQYTTPAELMMLGAKLFEKEIIESEDFNYDCFDVVKKLGDKIIKVVDGCTRLGYLINGPVIGEQ